MLELDVMPERSIGCEQWEFILGDRSLQFETSETQILVSDILEKWESDIFPLILLVIEQIIIFPEIYAKFLDIFSGMVFNSSDVLPTMDQIEHSFGATLPGLYSPTTHDYVVYFRGVSFYFPVTKYQTGSPKFVNAPSPWASLITIYTGSSERAEETAPLPLSCYNGQVHLYRTGVLRDGRLRLCMYTTGATRSMEPKKENLNRTVGLNDSAETVATNLGAPNRVFFKSEDKMRIHSPSHHRRSASTSSDYFYNYFTLGMVTAYTKWDTIADRLNVSPKPVVLNRASSINTKNFFGATLCYGYSNYIFEVHRKCSGCLPEHWLCVRTMGLFELELFKTQLLRLMDDRFASFDLEFSFTFLVCVNMERVMFSVRFNILPILRHHILPHTVCTAAVRSNRISSIDLAANWVHMEQSESGAVLLDKTAKIAEGDKMATNGVLHVVDTFIIPSSGV
ncbi:unnamed protein product [Nesidiocoris tenuis]|uniref:FAS1 domain-containing protein n=1 Tax=Nesidiocoris tenuis TaxID=355587 RepID=A0A6H5HK76_9HEMI|nr:unnamed protein product [Nesidiocoris tenuis]